MAERAVGLGTGTQREQVGAPTPLGLRPWCQGWDTRSLRKRESAAQGLGLDSVSATVVCENRDPVSLFVEFIKWW